MKKLAHYLTFVYLYFLSATNVFAQDGTGFKLNLFETQPGGGGLRANTPPQVIITNAITIVYTVASLLVLVYLIWGSFKWIVSGGDKESLKSAKGMITHALIGLGMLSLSFVILKIVGGLLGINLDNLFLPPLDRMIVPSR